MTTHAMTRRALALGLSLGVVVSSAACTKTAGVDTSATTTAAAPGTSEATTTTTEASTDTTTKKKPGTTVVLDDETTTTRRKARTTTTEDDTPTTEASSSGRASSGTFSATTRFKGAADWTFHVKPAADPTADTSAAQGKIIYDGPNKAQIEIVGPDNLSSAHSLDAALADELNSLGSKANGEAKKVTISGDSGLFQLAGPPATSDDLAAIVVVMHELHPYYVVVFCDPADASTDVSVMAEIADSINWEI